jgi:negative regulator of flagellin synthesis FlgM
MEIKSTNPLIVLNNNVQRLESSPLSERVRKSGGASSDSDRIELSVRSREIAHFNDLIQSTPDIRESRVNEVRMQLENGTYNVKAEKIAEKIIGGNPLDEFF